MPEKKVLRLTCPVCETRLKVAEGIERFACLNCGAELNLEPDGDLLKLVPTQASAARMSDSQQQLIEVNSALKTADDVYGVGCAIATMGITLVACIILALAIVVQSQVLFWAAIGIALLLLAFVLFMFLTASSRGTDPLLRKRDELQAQVEAEEITDYTTGAGEETGDVETGQEEFEGPGSEAGVKPTVSEAIETPFEGPVEPNNPVKPERGEALGK
jgi:hypothetical protein